MLSCTLTILFEAPFWVGLYERSGDGRYEVCKITFGAEPRDYEVYAFILRYGGRLAFSPAVADTGEMVRHRNPKRMQREIRKSLADTGIGTKAQQVLQLQREQNKQERKDVRKERRAAEQERQFRLRREKKKAKHRGR